MRSLDQSNYSHIESARATFELLPHSTGVCSRVSWHFKLLNPFVFLSLLHMNKRHEVVSGKRSKTLILFKIIALSSLPVNVCCSFFLPQFWRLNLFWCNVFLAESAWARHKALLMFLSVGCFGKREYVPRVEVIMELIVNAHKDINLISQPSAQSRKEGKSKKKLPDRFIAHSVTIKESWYERAAANTMQVLDLSILLTSLSSI